MAPPTQTHTHIHALSHPNHSWCFHYRESAAASLLGGRREASCFFCVFVSTHTKNNVNVSLHIFIFAHLLSFNLTYHFIYFCITAYTRNALRCKISMISQKYLLLIFVIVKSAERDLARGICCCEGTML